MTAEDKQVQEANGGDPRPQPINRPTSYALPVPGKDGKVMHFTATALDFLRNEAREGYILTRHLGAAYDLAARRAKEKLVQRDGVFDLPPLSAASEYLKKLAKVESSSTSMTPLRVGPSTAERATRQANTAATPHVVAPSSTQRVSEPPAAKTADTGSAGPQGNVEEAPLAARPHPLSDVLGVNASETELDEGESQIGQVVSKPRTDAMGKVAHSSEELQANAERVAQADWRQRPRRYEPPGDNQPYEELPGTIDYQNRPGSRPVLVVSFNGALDGGASPTLRQLTKELHGYFYQSNSDNDVGEALKQINDFQRQHPDGIVVVLAYSHGGWTFRNSIAGRTRRPIDIAVFFDPYNRGWLSGGGADMELPAGSVRRGYNFYQQNETTGIGGPNAFRGSRILNQEFENIDLTGKTTQKRQTVGHSAIIDYVLMEREYEERLRRALRR